MGTKIVSLDPQLRTYLQGVSRELDTWLEGIERKVDGSAVDEYTLCAREVRSQFLASELQSSSSQQYSTKVNKAKELEEEEEGFSLLVENAWREVGDGEQLSACSQDREVSSILETLISVSSHAQICKFILRCARQVSQ
jgi:hypothetical protein